MTPATDFYHIAHRSGKAAIGMIIGLFVTFAVLGYYLTTWPDPLELKLLDQRHRLTPLVHNDPSVVVFGIDDRSVEQIGRWPWPRKTLADIVTICKNAGAAQIIFDINFPEEQRIEFFLEGVSNLSRYEPAAQLVGQPLPQKIDNDAILAEAMAQNPIVTVPFYVELSKTAPPPPNAVSALLAADPALSFEQVYHTLHPEQKIEYRDTDYQAVLLDYIRYSSINYLKRFSFEPPQPINSPAVYEIQNFTPPIPDFARVAANTGFVSVLADADGNVRRIPQLARFENHIFPQLAFSAACKKLGLSLNQLDLSNPHHIRFKNSDLEIPIDSEGRLIISWADVWKDQYCMPVTMVAEIWDKQNALKKNQDQLRLIDNLSFQLSTLPADLSSLDENTRRQIEEMKQMLSRLESRETILAANADVQKSLADAQNRLSEFVNGKIVLIGSITTGVFDFFVTPLGKSTPGVMVHRNILNTILQRSFINRPHRAFEITIILALGLMMSFVAATFRPLASGLTLLTLIAITLGLNFEVAFARYHLWLAVATPLMAILAVFTAVTFYRQITEGRAKRHVTAHFKQYISPAVVDRIVQSGGHLTFAGETRRITCFFSDLAGFTSVSEKLGPQKTVAILNHYLDRMTEVLDRFDATINKFQGDGIFAFFGAPVPQPDQCRLACMAALEAQNELNKLVHQQQQQQSDFPSLKMRIGLSVGEVVVGDCGSHRRFDYTAIGDTVNLASRLEGANKAFGTHIMICQNVFDDAQALIETRQLGKVRVVGKKIPVGIYELLGPAGQCSPADAQYRDLFQNAVEHFQQARFDQAAQAFDRCLQARPYDHAALLYRRTLTQFAAFVPPPDFDGAIELSSK